MTLDYVLVKASHREALAVARRLQQLARVREVHALFGEWDFILKVRAEPALEGVDAIQEIRHVAGVIATKWLGVSRVDAAPRGESAWPKAPSGWPRQAPAGGT